ncbi:MAG TPA: molybdopterin-synthase adenylyltransferase MoeB [Terriglobales bacterium]|nr:molybdopterin-synthase adenylyltransferase MoeB [Terriglobales bacterium]
MATAVEPAVLNKEEILRYSRHLIIPEVGMEGQQKLKQARVLTIGAGGLGAPVGLYLAAAGVGTIGIVDFDVVDFSNLQRQVIHATADVGRSKLESARESITAINSNVKVVGYNTRLDSSNALEIFRGYDLVIDGTDNFPTRYLVNDACVLSKIPNVYASIYRFEGQASVLGLQDGPCYRCWYPEPPPPGLVPSCAEGGVLGVLPGIMGMIQATEAVKLIIGIGEPLKNRVLLVDALNMKFRELKLRKNPHCPVCGDHPTVTALIDYQEFCGLGRGGVAPAAEAASAEAASEERVEVTARELKQELDAGKDVFILDVREPFEFAIGRIANSVLIPLGELPRRMEELDRERTIVAHCKMGGRSAKAVEMLRAAGFPHVRNLTGGILAWSDQVDPSVPKY